MATIVHTTSSDTNYHIGVVDENLLKILVKKHRKNKTPNVKLYGKGSLVFVLDEYAGEISKLKQRLLCNEAIGDYTNIHIKIHSKSKSNRQKWQAESLIVGQFKIGAQNVHKCNVATLGNIIRCHHILATVLEIKKAPMEQYIERVAGNKDLLRHIDSFYLALVELLDIVAPDRNSVAYYENRQVAHIETVKRIEGTIEKVDTETAEHLRGVLELVLYVRDQKEYVAAKKLVYDMVGLIASHLATDAETLEDIRKLRPELDVDTQSD